MHASDATNAQSGNENALTQLFVSHRSQLRSMVDQRLDRRVAQRVDASDVLQEGFIEAADRFEEYQKDPRMPLLTWLRFLVHQRLLAIHRRHLAVKKRDARREVSPDHRVAGRECSKSASATPSRIVAKAETHHRLFDAIHKLSEQDQEILMLRHFREFSNDEAASALGLSRSASSKRYVRAIERLRSQFDGESVV